MRLSKVSAALVAALVGYSSTIALVLSAAQAVGATPSQTASWLLAVCLATGLGSFGLSLWSRIPMVLAWSTPGAALIATSQGDTMAEAAGAFVLAGLLIALTGLVKPLGRAVALIPDGVAAGMLAGVLLPFCLKGAAAVTTLPWVLLPMFGLFAVVRIKNPALAVLAALALGLGVAFASGMALLPSVALPVPTLEVTLPAFRIEVLIGLGVPLYLVTMASQNLPGFAVLRAAGYEPPVRPALLVTGGLSAVAGLFAGHPVNMAAITAAICLSDDVHPDRAQRWRVGMIYGAIWVGLGVLSPVILPLLAALPEALMLGLVALALLGPLMGAMTGALLPVETRFAAVLTMVVTGSGVAAFGVGAAFWGLAAGLVVYGLGRVVR